MEWQPIETMPPNVRVAVKRDDCPGYNTTAVLVDGKIECASWFIRKDMLLIKVPTHWMPLQPAPDTGG